MKKRLKDSDYGGFAGNKRTESHFSEYGGWVATDLRGVGVNSGFVPIEDDDKHFDYDTIRLKRGKPYAFGRVLKEKEKVECVVREYKTQPETQVHFDSSLYSVRRQLEDKSFMPEKVVVSMGVHRETWGSTFVHFDKANQEWVGHDKLLGDFPLEGRRIRRKS